MANNPRQKTRVEDMTTRLPPWNLEAEQGALGCVLLNPQESVPVLIEKFGEVPEVFYDLRHQTIFMIMLEMYGDNQPIDLVTLVERLEAWSRLDEVGGIPYISSLADKVPSAANLPYYVEIVYEKCLLRRMVRACTEAVSRIYSPEGMETQELLDRTEKEVLAVTETRSEEGTPPIRQLVTETLSEMENSMQNPGTITGLSTGYSDLDRATSGLQNGEMIVIAGRPSDGKTSLAMNIAEYVAVDLQLGVGVFSLEMSARMLTQRLICSRARVNSRRWNEGFVAAGDAQRITASGARIGSAPLYIDDTSGLSILQARAKARRLKQRYDIKLLVIDYLQLMNNFGSRRKYENRQMEITDISSGCKDIAKDLGIPVIVLSQLNRAVEREQNRKPRLSDLRESGAIEQDSDVVGMLYQPSRAEEEEEIGPSDPRPVNLLIAKQRNGERNRDIEFTLLPTYTRFELRSRISDEDISFREVQQPELQPQ